MEPYRHRRRVGFGECDPARIFFAPRAIEYTVEAAEAFCEARLGASWSGLAAREVRVLAFDCTYERSITASQEVELAVEAAAARPDTLELRAVAEVAPAAVSFRASLTLGLFEPGGGARLPFPTHLLERLPRVAPAAGSTVREWPDAAPAPVPGAFTRVHRVRWGDCAPSGDVYAPRVADWAVEAVGEWYARTLGVSWIEQCRRGRGTPFLRIACPRLARMTAGTPVTLEVAIPRLGNASIAYRVVGRGEGGAPLFEVDMAACYISEEAGPPRATPFPDGLRERIVAYQAATSG